MSIWEKLSKPIYCLAPMEDVTDTVFRQLLCDLGKPALMFSEFTNIRSLYSHSQDQRRLEYTDQEKPLILQIWGMEPELYYNAADLAFELGYDGVDINMGCPQKKIVKKGACSALINDQVLAGEIIQATIEGARGRLPVSVKTRIGYGKVVTQEWASFLLTFKIAALTIHGRTSAQMSAVPANWEEIGKVVKLRDSLESKTLILGNGDILTLSQAEAMVKTHKVDGVMIGRGIFQDPWLFNQNHPPVDHAEKLRTLKKHVELWEQVWNRENDFNRLKRFFKIYCNGFEGASELRARLMSTTTATQVYEIIDTYLL